MMWLLLAAMALPSDHAVLPLPCSTVQQTVALLGAAGAEALAARQGWTAQQIAEARRVCLAKPNTKQPDTNQN